MRRACTDTTSPCRSGRFLSSGPSSCPSSASGVYWDHWWPRRSSADLGGGWGDQDETAPLLFFNDALTGRSPFRKPCFLLNNCVTVTGAVLMILSRTVKSFEMIMVARFIYGISAGEAGDVASALLVCMVFLMNSFIDGFCHHSLISICVWSSSGRAFSTYWSPIDWDCSSFAPSGIGFSVHSLYLVECAPKRLRGMVGVSLATFASFGKFLAQLLGIRWAVTYTPGSQGRGQVEAGSNVSWHVGVANIVSFWCVNTYQLSRAYFCSIINKWSNLSLMAEQIGRCIRTPGNAGGVLEYLKSN